MSLQERLGITAPLFLMDGSAFIYRGFYANRSLQRSDGFPTNALYVVTRILLRILREEKPEHFVFVLDGKGKNFRHDLFPLYKANRDATPEELVQQLEPIRRMVQALGLRLEVSEGCEADDCIASLAHRHAAERPVVIIGADKDLRQCLGPQVFMWDPAAKEEKLITEKDFTEETGLSPQQWPDVQAIIGDTSDNIPGVPGIGPKTAQKIFADFASLEAIRDGLALMQPKMRQKLEAHVEAMFLYRKLTTLSTDYCQDLTLDDMRVRAVEMEKAGTLLQEFELTSLRREMESMVRAGSLVGQGGQGSQGNRSETGSMGARQGSLFGTVNNSAPTSAPPLPVIKDSSALPSCRDLPVALLPLSAVPTLRHAGQGFVLGLAGKEWRFEGSLTGTGGLLPWLSTAAHVITPDVKALCRTDADWFDLPQELWFDLGLAAYLLNPEERDYGWPRLAAHWGALLDTGASTGSEATPALLALDLSRGGSEATPALLALDLSRGGSEGTPALLALDMGAALAGRLAEHHLDRLYHELEMPLIPVLARMERQGVAVDIAAFQHFLQDVQGELDRLTHAVYDAAGTTFNIRSAQQLGEVLFTTLQLPTAGKTRGGQLSTAQMSLEKLAGHHPVVDTVLEFRKLEKLRSTYLEPLPRLVDASGRIHTTFNQLATATGRLSSSNPNLQNIPVRGELGQRMRACFVAEEGQLLVSADYSQVELRVLAHMSQDPALLDAFRQNKDIHTSTAALIFNEAPDAVTPDQRRNAKTINFGLIYGMGAQKLAQELKIPHADAKEFIARYFEKLGKLKEFYDSVEESAKELGYVSTLAGRRRAVPDIRSQNGQAFALARRQAINTVIQGSAADIIKLAMLEVAVDDTLRQLGASVLLQVHDELLLETPAEHAEDAGRRVAAIMQGVTPGGKTLDVPLLVDWGVGQNWGDAH